MEESVDGDGCVNIFPVLAQQLPEAIRRVLPNIELDLGATLDAARANFFFGLGGAALATSHRTADGAAFFRAYAPDARLYDPAT